MAHQNARIIPIADFNKGVNQAPGFLAKARSAAEEMENLVVGLQGRPQLRKGYIDADVSDVSVGTEGGEYASGDQLVVVHWLGDEDTPGGVKRIYYLDRQASWIQDEIGRLMFVVGTSDTPKFVDVKENVQYDWVTDKPMPDNVDMQFKEDVSDFSETYFEPTIDADPNLQLIREGMVESAQIRVFPSQIGAGSDRFVAIDVTASTDISLAQVRIFDSLGVEVRDIFYGDLPQGGHRFGWDLRNEDGERVVAGTYRAGVTIIDSGNGKEQRTVQNGAFTVTGGADVDQPPIFHLRRQHRYVTFTFANDDLVLESLPSDVLDIPVPFVEDFDEDNETDLPSVVVSWDGFGGIDDIPNWANKVNVYVSDDPPPPPTSAPPPVKPQETGQVFRKILEIDRSGTDSTEFSTSDTFDGKITRDALRLDSHDHDAPVADTHTMGAYGVGVWAAAGNRVYFNKIGNQGEQRIYALPSENALVPHSFPLSKSGQSTILHIHPAAQESALLAFKRDAIHVIKGSGVISGLYNPQTAVEVDVDASSVIVGTGTSSARSVLTVGSSVYFVGSDKKFWEYGHDWRGATRLRDIGLPIQKYLDEISDADLPNLVAFLYANCYHLITPDRVIIMDMTRQYWTASSWQLEDAIWSRGGEESESILYGITQSGDLVELYEGDTDGGDAIGAKWRSNPTAIPSESTLTGVMVVHTNNPPPKLMCKIILDDVEGESREFTPAKYNDFRFGTHASGSRVSVELESADGFPRMDRVAAEIFLAR